MRNLPFASVMVPRLVPRTVTAALGKGVWLCSTTIPAMVPCAFSGEIAPKRSGSKTRAARLRKRALCGPGVFGGDANRGKRTRRYIMKLLD